MTDMKKTIRRPLYIVFTAVICLHLCAFLQSNAGFTINTEENHVYTYVTVSDLLKQQNSDEKAAKEKYDGQYILLVGEFEQKKFCQFVCQAWFFGLAMTIFHQQPRFLVKGI